MEPSSLVEYKTFLRSRAQVGGMSGFEPKSIPEFLFPFQKHLVEWAIRKGRAAILADCGLGKTPMQLVWADAVVRHTNKPVLILTPLAVGPQTVREAAKFGIDAERSGDGKHGTGIVVSNYERLHLFDPANFSGMVCDESGILKSFGGQTRKDVTRFMCKLEYRLLCTATPSPNDYTELGTSSEALGELSYSDMLRRFFVYLDDKGQKRELRLQVEAEAQIKSNPSYYKKLAFRISQTIDQWRIKHHAVDQFWRWVASWAMACRKPSDLGFDNAGFDLPALTERSHIVKSSGPPDGMLFNVPAFGLAAERDERKRSLSERCGLAAELVNHKRPAVVWCHANAEGDMLEKMIPDSRQVAGATPDDEKIEIYEAFAAGALRVVIIKPKIGAWGLNWQHCNHVVTFASHSYEQRYQAIRRCWRFGQKRPVTVDTISTEGEVRVVENLRAKSERASAMFERLVAEMNRSCHIGRTNIYTNKMEKPEWL